MPVVTLPGVLPSLVSSKTVLRFVYTISRVSNFITGSIFMVVPLEDYLKPLRGPKKNNMAILRLPVMLTYTNLVNVVTICAHLKKKHISQIMELFQLFPFCNSRLEKNNV